MATLKYLRKLPFHNFIFNMISKTIIKYFHLLYYSQGKQTWMNTYWMGTPLMKCPLDLWIYQEMIYEIKPDVIIECGTNKGGSAKYLAFLLDNIGKGRIITIDIVDVKTPENATAHPRIKWLIGSSTSKEIVSQVKSLISPNEKVMVILDSNHSKAHVLEELRSYNSLVDLGNYIIVEDSNMHGHPVLKNSEEGPMEAIEIFLKENKNFTIDKSREKLMMTFNPNGYLKRIK